MQVQQLLIEQLQMQLQTLQAEQPIVAQQQLQNIQQQLQFGNMLQIQSGGGGGGGDALLLQQHSQQAALQQHNQQQQQQEYNLQQQQQSSGFQQSGFQQQQFFKQQRQTLLGGGGNGGGSSAQALDGDLQTHMRALQAAQAQGGLGGFDVNSLSMHQLQMLQAHGQNADASFAAQAQSAFPAFQQGGIMSLANLAGDSSLAMQTQQQQQQLYDNVMNI